MHVAMSSPTWLGTRRLKRRRILSLQCFSRCSSSRVYLRRPWPKGHSLRCLPRHLLVVEFLLLVARKVDRRLVRRPVVYLLRPCLPDLAVLHRPCKWRTVGTYNILERVPVQRA